MQDLELGATEYKIYKAVMTADFQGTSVWCCKEIDQQRP